MLVKPKQKNLIINFTYEIKNKKIDFKEQNL